MDEKISPFCRYAAVVADIEPGEGLMPFKKVLAPMIKRKGLRAVLNWHRGVAKQDPKVKRVFACRFSPENNGTAFFGEEIPL
jgi:hypothetical protein